MEKCSTGPLREHADGEPYGFVQWKGTNVCVDLHCSCGAHLHADADFLYAVRCPHCGQAWELEPFVRLLPQEKPCPFHDPVLMDPECDTCGFHPCEHTDAWEKAGKPVPLPEDWPETAENRGKA